MSVYLKTCTDYDLDHLEELQRVAGKTFGRKEMLRKRGFALVMGGLLLATGLSLAIRRGSVLLALCCCALGALLLAWGVFFYQVTAWNSGRSMGSRREGNEFHFEQSEILAIRGVDSSRFPYTSCTELMETENNLYFMLNDRGMGLMLDKSNVRGGTADELRTWLMEKTGKDPTWVGKQKR